MKKLALIVGFIFQTILANAQADEKIHWMTLNEAIDANSKNPKKIFIDVYTNWCGWCKRMDATTFEDKGVIKYMNATFYPVKLDAETKDTILFKNKAYTFVPEYKSNEIAAFFLNGQMSYPTSVYLDEKLDLIGPMPGYLTKDQLLPVLKYFGNNTFKTKKWEDFLKENFK